MTDPRVKREVYLGPWGAAETVEAYRRWCRDYLEGKASPAPGSDSPGAVAVAELLERHLAWAAQEYRKGGRPTSEVRMFGMAGKRALAVTAPGLAAEDFGPDDLAAARQRMADDGLARGTVRGLVARLRRVWAWGVEHKLVTASAWHALCAPRRVSRAGRGRPTPEVGPVPWALVQDTLPRLPEALRQVLLVQYYGAMRPGEAVLMRPRDVDRAAAPWVYRPSRHKNEDREGRAGVREVRLGPQAREILTPLLAGCPAADAWVFRGRFAGSHVRASAVREAVRLACLREPALAHWHPNQLRHAMATEIRLKFHGGDVHPLEASQAALGHARADMTQRYAQAAADLAARVAEALG